MKVLFVTAIDDEPAAKVESILQQRGVQVVRFDPEDFPSRAQLTIEFAGGAPVCTLRLGTENHTIADFNAIWSRRPGRPLASSAIEDPDVRQFVTEHSREFLAAFWDVSDGRWLPARPSTMISAQQKGPQLKRAVALGFEIPPTALTNDPANFLEFYRQQQGKIISKLGGGMFFPLRPGEEFSRYTEVVTTRDVGYSQDVSYCPIVIQAYVPKRVEIRITVVGEKLFAAEIHSQTTNRTRHDWRRYDLDTTPYFVHDLPEAVAERCVSLVKACGLLFGAIDMVLTPAGHYVFLELNPSGEYAWIEEFTGLPISVAIADLLCESAPRLTANRIEEAGNE